MDAAYVIKKLKKVFYKVLIVETTTENILEFERISRIDASVLRTLVINTENERNYIQSTQFAKTDVSKDEREKRDFKKFNRFNKKDNYNKDGYNKDHAKVDTKVNKETEVAKKESK